MKARSALAWSDGAAGPVLRLVDPEPVPACRLADPETFFPETLGQAGPAKAICAACPLRPSCLAGAIDRREIWGVWGGELFSNGHPVTPPGSKPRYKPGPRRRNGKTTDAVSLWCGNEHRRSVENTRTEADGRIRCLECARERSRKSRARKAAGARQRLELVA